MKSEKPKKREIIFIIYIVCILISFVLPEVLHLYDTMLGAAGLKNIIAAIVLKSVAGLVVSIPVLIFGIIYLIDIFKNRKEIKNPVLVFSAFLFLTVTIPAILYFGFNRTRFNIQQDNKNMYGLFAEARIGVSCILDLFTDDYDEFTINNCYVRSGNYLTMTGRGNSSEHNEYTASFYYNKRKIKDIQIGKNEYGYLTEMIPAKFDTKITVYKRSGFLRSVEPTVDFSRSESYEHFFTISFAGDRIVYEKNIEEDFKDLQWSGFRKNESNDVQNSLFGIGISEERPSLGSDYVGLLCDEVCIYTVVDGKYRRVSNILTKDDKIDQK